jgi:hypothetical protein
MLLTRHIRPVLLVAAAVSAISFAGAGGASAAGAPVSAGRFQVTSKISAHLVDHETLALDEHCGLGGTTSQDVVLVPRAPGTQLGTGRPDIDYGGNRGPFRDAAGTPVHFICGDEVSVCSHPSTVARDVTGDVFVRIEVTLFEADGIWLPCYRDDLVARHSVTLRMRGNSRACLPGSLTLGDAAGDRVTIGRVCASAVYLDPVPAPTPLTVSGPSCSFADEAFTCEARTAGGVAPVDIRWTVNGRPVPAFDARPTLTGLCRAGFTVRVAVAAVDGTGQTAQRSSTHRCL